MRIQTFELFKASVGATFGIMDYRSSMSSSSSSSSSSAAAREASARCREYLIALAKNVALDLPEVLGDSNNSDVTAASGDSAKRSDHKEYLSSLSQQIVSLGEAQARLEKEIDTRDSVMSGVLRSMPTVTGGASSSSSSSASSSSSSSSSQAASEAEVIKKAHKDVQAAVTAYDASSAAVVRELKTMLQVHTLIYTHSHLILSTIYHKIILIISMCISYSPRRPGSPRAGGGAGSRRTRRCRWSTWAAPERRTSSARTPRHAWLTP